MLKRIYATSSGITSSSYSIPDVKQSALSTIKLSTGENYTPKPGSLVTVTRAISARVNQNYDGFPSEELKKSAHTFVGRPVYVNHNNEDHHRTRGMIIDSVYKEAGKDKFIELTIEVDAQNFPKLAALIATGELDSVSMGTDVQFTKCSYCDNVAHDIEDFCDHVKYQKGQKLTKTDKKTGKKESVLVYESCHGLNFFEISYVFDPADETAINQKVYLPKMSKLRSEALGELASPPRVDTLKDNEPCPQCGDDSFDGKECDWCEYTTPPKDFQDPDTMKSRVLQMVRNDPHAQNNQNDQDSNIDSVVRHNPNAGKEGSRMGATQLQKVLARKRLEDAQMRLADIDSTVEQSRVPDWETDVTNIDSNPVTFDEAREPDGKADVTKLEPSAGLPKSSRKQADFPDNSAPPSPAAGGPGASAPDAGPDSTDGADASQGIDSLPITWNQDESGQPYGTVDGTGLDIFVNEDMTWQVLPEGSDQPIDQGQGSSYEDCVQQAFQSAQSGGSQGAPADPSAAPADPSAAPAGPPAAAGADPTKVSKVAAGGVPAASESAKPDKRDDVTKLPTYDTMDDGGHTFPKDEFAHNAGDDLAKPDDGTEDNFAPGGGSFKDNNKKASVQRVSAIKAAELVDLYMEMGIVPSNHSAKYAAIGEVSKLSRETVQDRINLLEQVQKGQERVASRPRNTVPRLAARVPNMTSTASKSSSYDDDILLSL